MSTLSTKVNIFNALKKAYATFDKKWGIELMPHLHKKLPKGSRFRNRKMLLDLWVEIIDENITQQHIEQATEYCVKHLIRKPGFTTFHEYCKQAAMNIELQYPVSIIEKQASDLLIYLKKNFDDKKNLPHTDLSSSFVSELDHLLIAVVVLQFSAYKNHKANMEDGRLWFEELQARITMFARALEEWLVYAERDDNFWLKKIFAVIDPQELSPTNS